MAADTFVLTPFTKMARSSSDPHLVCLHHGHSRPTQNEHVSSSPLHLFFATYFLQRQSERDKRKEEAKERKEMAEDRKLLQAIQVVRVKSKANYFENTIPLPFRRKANVGLYM